MAENVKLDRFDRALLALVQQDTHMPARVLAARTGISESSVLRRLRQMRKDGVIIADVAVVSPAATGEPVTVHVLVSLERERAFDLDNFIQGIRRRTEVKNAWYVTGEMDFVLLLRLPHMDAYSDFVHEVFHSDSNVKSFKSIVSIRQIV